MENMDKQLTVPKWVLINQPKIPQMPQNLSAQIVCPSSKVWDFDKKRLQSALRTLEKFRQNANGMKRGQPEIFAETETDNA